MNKIHCSTINNESLSHYIIINEMVSKTGCTHEQAEQFLISTKWRLQAAIELFFNERTIPIPCCKFSELLAPANTPVTPPNFPETLLSLGKLSTSENLPNDNQITSTTH
ncbi:unnamed protein product [Rotaria sp. Silwood1]|nr:unnamed protein product [Rotaria sp. Silwood1]CAF3751862.1 unnamed protein product [Rotaria sp. Silwood1]CAF4758453.1 unnamed protein product [Rotaria sp. Silwood1]